MAGLDPTLIDHIDWETANKRVLLDARTDLILSPHYNAIHERSSGDLIELVRSQLRSGTYNPSLPLIADVPKERGFTRPGAVLTPLDRLTYQGLVDLCLPSIELQFDRSRSFSHLPSDDAENLFSPNHDSWRAYQERLRAMCDLGGTFIRADVANYFERIPQHHVINLLSAADCPPGAVRLLEEMLLAFRERNSFGIPQGVYSSDILGNFYMTELDAYYAMNDIDSARYVDDLYLRFPSEIKARNGLIDLIDRLRRSGLHLNEAKSGIFSASHILRDETEVDDLFQEAREEAESELSDDAIYSYYGLAADWALSPRDESEVELEAVKRLLDSRFENPASWDKIVRFCLPTLAVARSEYAVDLAIKELDTRPHLSRVYLTYLRTFVAADQTVAEELSRLVLSDAGKTDYDLMYLFGTLLSAETIRHEVVDRAIRLLLDRSGPPEMRALAAIFGARHGTAAQKRMVRTSYEDEPSEYVRGAILFSATFFTSAERSTCKRAWGGHSVINSLIALTI